MIPAVFPNSPRTELGMMPTSTSAKVGHLHPGCIACRPTWASASRRRPPTPTRLARERPLSAVSTNPVVDNLDNALPEFREGGDKQGDAGRPLHQEEDVDAEANVVVNPDGTTPITQTIPNLDPVMATDPNGTADELTYTLDGGRDKDSFADRLGHRPDRTVKTRTPSWTTRPRIPTWSPSPPPTRPWPPRP